MSRTDQRRRRALRAAAPIAGLLVAGLLVWQGSTAAFSATTDNGSENWATGSLVLQNDGGTGTYANSTTAIFNDTNLKIPSAAVSKCLTVKSTGTSAGTLGFYRGALGGTNTTTLPPQISLTVKAMPAQATDPAVTKACVGFNAGTATTLSTATTTLSTLPVAYPGLGAGVAVAAGTQFVAYQFTYTLTSTGTNANDNLLQGANSTAPFWFEIQ
jgi:hypothetical protein